MNYSEFQEAIFGFLQTKTGSLFIKAGPGCGKTSTIVAGAPCLTGSTLFCCFNKAIAEELSSRLPSNVKASTIHSHGFGSLLRAKHGRKTLDKYKYKNIAEEALEPLLEHMDADKYASNDEKPPSKFKLITELVKLIEMSLNTRTEYGQHASVTEIETMASTYNLTVSDPFLYGCVLPCINAGIEMFKQFGIFDYIDQICFPVMCGFPIQKYKNIVIDEGQDLNAAQLELLFNSLEKDGRMVMVADPNQSIMGFTGAMPDACDNFITRASAEVLPLSCCYRCPPNVVAIAKFVDPNLTAFKTEDGIIEAIEIDSLIKIVEIRDFILCRLTAPLVSCCLSLIAKNKPALIKGKEIGDDLISFVEETSTRQKELLEDWQNFPKALEEEQVRLREKMQKQKREVQIELLEDKVTALIALFDFYDTEVTNIEQYKAKIRGLFVEKVPESTITLCTVHRSKGLEANRIFLLDGNMMRNYWPIIKDNTMNWQRIQELNLFFVGMTRPKKELYIVTDHSKLESRKAYFTKGLYANIADRSVSVTEKPKPPPVKIQEPITVPNLSLGSTPKSTRVISIEAVTKRKKEKIDTWKKSKLDNSEPIKQKKLNLKYDK